MKKQNWFKRNWDILLTFLPIVLLLSGDFNFLFRAPYLLLLFGIPLIIMSIKNKKYKRLFWLSPIFIVIFLIILLYMVLSGIWGAG